MVHKKELISRTAKRAEKSQESCSEIITAFIEEITTALINEEDVVLRELGRLALVQRKSRQGYDIKKGKPIIIPARKEVVFRPFKRIKLFYKSQY